MGELADAGGDGRDLPDRYEFSRPLYRLEAQADGVVLPILLLRIRRARHPDAAEHDATDWEDLGPVKLRLIPVPHPPPGHAPVALQLEAAVQLAALWDGTERRTRGRG